MCDEVGPTAVGRGQETRAVLEGRETETGAEPDELWDRRLFGVEDFSCT